jgi:type III pantothenate kinase
LTYLLAVDVGNTNVSLGAFEGDRLKATWRLSTDSRRTEDEHFLLFEGLLRSRGLKASEITAVSMCSVVPPLTDTVRRALERLAGTEPVVVGSGTRTGIKIGYDRPQDVGADRIVDAVAAFHVYGAPAVVVDLGTATVFDAVSVDGDYLGGALSPGISLSAEALYSAASMLRRVALEPPGKAIGTNTVAALQSGLVYGYVGLVEGMVRRFIEELATPENPDVRVIATGGLAKVIASETDVFTAVDEDLTLTGLRLIHELNS